MAYKVNLDSFQGPFDLLVYLIENAKMSIYDIEISQITREYIDHIGKMRNLNIPVASEFMVLASTLLEIKSKMLLPREELSKLPQTEEDPRSQLVEKLIEYKKFKEGAKVLQENFEKASLSYPKAKEDLSFFTEEENETLNLDIDQLVDQFLLMIERQKKLEEVRARYVKIEREKATLQSRMEYISLKLKNEKKTLPIKDLILEQGNSYDLVLTFVAVLQMTRDGFLTVEQNSMYGDILIGLKEGNR